MENKNIKFIDVEQDFHIGGASTSEIVRRFKRLIDLGIIDISKAVLCTIKYVIRENYPEKGPVTIYFLDGTRVKLNLTAGFRGSGPLDTCHILELCTFKFDKEDILSPQDSVNLKYYKDCYISFK